MLRFHFACLLFDAMLTCATIAAPVPKEKPKDKELTADQFIGGWNLHWGPWGDGAMVLGSDGSYVCVKSPRSFETWSGTWEFKDGTLLITEYVYDSIADRTSGPFRHTVVLEAKGAELVGKANGTTDVRMWNRTK